MQELARQKPGVAAEFLSNPQNLHIKMKLRTCSFQLCFRYFLHFKNRVEPKPNIVLVEQIQIRIMMSLYTSKTNIC